MSRNPDNQSSPVIPVATAQADETSRDPHVRPPEILSALDRPLGRAAADHSVASFDWACESSWQLGYVNAISDVHVVLKSHGVVTFQSLLGLLDRAKGRT